MTVYMYDVSMMSSLGVHGEAILASWRGKGGACWFGIWGVAHAWHGLSLEDASTRSCFLIRAKALGMWLFAMLKILIIITQTMLEDAPNGP